MDTAGGAPFDATIILGGPSLRFFARACPELAEGVGPSQNADILGFCLRIFFVQPPAAFTVREMQKGLKRYYGQDHFLTCSCYHRQPWLASASRRDLFLQILDLQILEETRQLYGFVVAG
jgi:hypothetical protein